MTDTPVSTAPAPTGRRGPVRRLYDWVLHWAATPYATPALFVLAVAESSFFPIPPDVLLIPLCVGRPRQSFRYATWCSVGSVLGGILGYWLGAAFWEAGLRDFCFHYVPGFTPELFTNVQAKFEAWNFWIVFAAGFTPIPYKVFTIAAGVFGVSFPMFVLASAVGRSARFFLVAALIRRYGVTIRDFIERRFGLVTIGGTALLIGGFAVVKYAL